MKQTAVEWLKNKLIVNGSGATITFPELFEQAKAMDEKNIKDSFTAGAEIGEMFNNENRCYVTDAEQYLKENFKSE